VVRINKLTKNHFKITLLLAD